MVNAFSCKLRKVFRVFFAQLELHLYRNESLVFIDSLFSAMDFEH